MKYHARMHNIDGQLDVQMKVGENTNALPMLTKSNGFGSWISGGEILFLAIATCYCNDIFREAKKMDIIVDSVDVEVDGDFMGAGQPAMNVECRIKVTAQASEEEIHKLVAHTDAIAEIPMSLRQGTPVTLTEVVAIES
ncbi:MAG TPA: OsmC family protein [Anaerolineales bacterium]|nr:OsmC family protein [Anaerolineales bacterium]